MVGFRETSEKALAFCARGNAGNKCGSGNALFSTREKMAEDSLTPSRGKVLDGGTSDKVTSY